MNNFMDILNVPFGYIIKFCYMIIPNYAIALLLFAVVVKLLTYPFGIKQQKNMIKQAKLRPKEMAIRKRYAGRTDKPTQQKMNEEVMNLYSKENYNPLGGCLPMLLQFPIIIALYNVIRNPLTYICNIGSSVEGIRSVLINAFSIAEEKVTLMTEIEMVSQLKENFAAFSEVLPAGFTVQEIPNFTIFGGAFDLALTPSFGEPYWLLAIPVLTFIASFLSMKLTRKLSYQPSADGENDAAKSMKIMDFTMPLFSVWITFAVPAMVGVYWIYQNILGVVQQFILSKMYPLPVFTEEDYRKAEKEMNGSVRKDKDKEKKPKVRSLHRIDEEDMEEQPKKLLSSGEKEKPVSAEEAVKGNESIIERAALKDDAPPPREKMEKREKEPANKGEAKQKPRSLHRIDEENAPAETEPQEGRENRSDDQ